MAAGLGLLASAFVLFAASCGDAEARANTHAAPAPLAVLGEVGTNPGQFVFPRALDAAPDGLWVIDKSARVQRIDPATGKATACFRMPKWELGKPTGVTVGPPIPAGVGAPYLLYIPDTHYNRVMIYKPPAALGEEPVLVGQFGEYGRGPGQFIYPTDVAVLTAADGRTVERLYVSEYDGGERVSVFDPELKYLFSFGGPGEALDPTRVEFNRPQSVQIDPVTRHLVVTDACNHRVGVFTLDGQLVRWIGSPEHAGDGPESFSYPYGLVLLGDGTALVSEIGNSRVHRVDYERGTSLSCLGLAGREKGRFMTPWGVALAGNRLYVLDSGNERIQVFPRPEAVRR